MWLNFDIMSENFSFSVSDIEYILRNTETIVPGITKVISIFYSEKIKGFKAFEVERPFMTSDFYDLTIYDNLLPEIENLRNDNEFAHSWLSPKDIPFAKKTHKIKPLDVFDEMEKHVLLVRLKNEFDGKSDLIFYYFNKDLSNFMPSTSEPMDQKHKLIIGKLMYNTVNFMAEKCRNDRKALKYYNKDMQDVFSALKNYEALIDNHDRALLNYANDILSELSSQGTHTYELSEKAKVKLKNYKGEIKSLEKIIKEASVSAAKYVDFNHVPVIIADYNLHFGDEAVSEIIPSVKLSESKYDKIIIWLDRIENAAIKAIKDGLSLTGLNLGKSCIPPISPPAISDFLHNNDSKIRKVLNEYPEKWPVIRTEFRPLINVLVSKKKDDEALNKQA